MKAFANDPRVVTAVISDSEDPTLLETFWSNLYLRGRMIVDPTGVVAGDEFAQPKTGLPFGRLFILAQDRTVELPLFGHNPQRVIDTVAALLDRTELALLAEPPVAATGDLVRFTTWGGAVGWPTILLLVEVDGVPTTLEMAAAAFDPRGIASHAECVPDDPALVGIDFRCRAYGFQHRDGRLAASEEVVVSIR